MHEATHETTTTRSLPAAVVAFPKGGRRVVKAPPAPKQETTLEILQDAGRIADAQRQRANADPSIHRMILDCLSLAAATRQYRQPAQPKPLEDKTRLYGLMDLAAGPLGIKGPRLSKPQPVVEPVVKPVSAATEARRLFRPRVRNSLAIDAIEKAARDAAATPGISRSALRGAPVVVLSMWREARP
jgi:hypothetical protein